MSTNRTPSRLDNLADRLMALNSPIYGDERQRRVILESSAFGASIGLYACLIGAVLTAAIGDAAASLVLVIVAGLISMGVSWYSERRGVDLTAMARRDPRAWRLAHATVLLALAAWAGALAFLGFAGRPLVPVPLQTGEFWAYVAAGGAFGALVGAVWSWISAGRTDPVDGLEPDDEF